MTTQSMPDLLDLPEPLPLSSLKHWTLDPTYIFLNHGSFGARPKAIASAQNRWRDEINARPIEMLDRKLKGLLEEAKSTIGGFLSMTSENFGFVTNATGAVNAVLRSMRFEPFDEILTTNHVYNAVRNSMRHLIERAGGTYHEVNVSFPIKSPDQVVEALEGGITQSTKLVIVDHITSPTAIVFPVDRIATICKARGIELMIDGAHAPGMLDLDVESIGATYYTGNLHKWVCAPIGAAFLWVSNEKRENIHPTTISHNLDQGLASEFAWQGTRDISPWLSSKEAIEWMADIGWSRVRAHNHALAHWARHLLSEKWNVELTSPEDGSMIGSMATMPVPEALYRAYDDAEQLRDVLYYEHRIEVPVMEWNERWWLRVSCQMYNTPDDYQKLGDVLTRLVEKA
ncbi:MAG: aminotransferase class V-fold PLP-dependent enzyme [Planctomycetota bacterium]|nr:aminotransferase class V-fold PLP-dependent enzyme [Planctomycetota bacterium]